LPSEVIGIDHIYIAVRDLRASEAFYDAVMPILGFRKNAFRINDASHIQYFNRHFGYVLRSAAGGTPPHNPYQPGMHHFCFRVEDPQAVEVVARELRTAGFACSALKRYPEYADDYWAIFFEDPDGIRLEVTNYRQERRERYLQWEELEDPDL
jgi:glyoxylase I family protein